MIRLVLAEPASVARELLLRAFRVTPDIEVVAIASSGGEALRLTKRLRPDIVVMGIGMPGLDGYATALEIMTQAPTPIVLVANEPDPPDAKLSVLALQAGALALVPSPRGPEPATDAAARQFASTIKAMAQVKVVRRWPERPPQEQHQIAAADARTARIVAMAASTGGPAALQLILSSLPATFAAPILIVQHISVGFVSDFAEWMDKISPLKVKIAVNGETLSSRTVYVAPDDRHLGVTAQHKVLLSSAPPVGGFRPSANFLFGSVAAAFGSTVLAVMLTGMGNDGVEGLRAVRAAKGKVIAQDEASSVVFGMPRAAIEAGVVNEVLMLRKIASELSERIESGSC